MAVNKNAILPYQVLDRCFKNKYKHFAVDELLSEVNKALSEFNGADSNIKKRQLYDDIKFMESEQGWNISLERIKNGKKVFLKYADQGYSISQQILNDSEKNKIQSALQVLSKFSGAPQFEWVHEILPVLQDKLQLKTKRKEFISLDHNPDLKGLHFLPQMYEAIDRQAVLEVKYKHFWAPSEEVIEFHPYFLKEYNKRWFALGLNAETGVSNWNLALDRIVSMKPANKNYIADETDWNDYFYDIIGVTKPADVLPETIVLEPDSEIAKYILTKPLHASQKVIELDSVLRISISVIPNKELMSLLLSFAPFIKIVKPEQIKATYQEMLAKGAALNSGV